MILGHHRLVILSLAVFIADVIQQASSNATLTPTVRIVSGEDAAAGEFPFMVSFQYSTWGIGPWTHFCGGTLITLKHVLSAASCFPDTGTYSAEMGIHRLDGVDGGEAQRRKIKNWFFHPKYKKDTFEHDMVVVELTSPVEISYRVNKLGAPYSDNPEAMVGLTCTVLGWGRTSDGGSYASNILQKASVTVMPIEKCRPHNPNFVHEDTICTEGLSPGSFCFGDAGGPLVCKHPYNPTVPVVYGIISSSTYPCTASANFYTRISEKENALFIGNFFNEKKSRSAGAGGDPAHSSSSAANIFLTGEFLTLLKNICPILIGIGRTFVN